MSRAALLIKRNDKETAPGNEHLGVKHGDPVDVIHDADEGWKGATLDQIISGRMNYKAFGVIEIDPKRVDDFRKYLVPINGSASKANYRPRKKRLDISKLTAKSGVTDERLKSADFVDLINGTDLIAGDFLDASVLSNEKSLTDVNAVSAGKYTIGTGGTYATAVVFFADVANLTADLSGTYISAVSEITQASLTENLGGFTFSVLSNLYHNGIAGTGNLITVAHGIHMFLMQQEGPGVTNVLGLDMVRTVDAGLNSFGFVVLNSNATAFTQNVCNNVIDGNSKGTHFVRFDDATPVCNIYNNMVWGLNVGILFGALDGNASSIYANNVFYGNTTGIDATANGGTFVNNACYANTTDFANTGGATGNNNASDDATGADGNWSSGSNNLINGTPATDFQSVTDTDGDIFLKPTAGGVLNKAGTDTGISGDTTYINSVPKISGIIDIGAKGLMGAGAGIFIKKWEDCWEE